MTAPKPDPSDFDVKDVEWKISSHSGGGGNCIRVAAKDGYILLGDSKTPKRLPRVFTATEWETFLLWVRDGEFDLG